MTTRRPISGFRGRRWRHLVGGCLALFVASCDGGQHGVDAESASEAALRRQLGVPDGAERVLVVSQSSHLDLNFLDTFDDYYKSSIQGIFSTALDVLDREPAYRYSIAEIAWVRRYWNDHPGDRERLRRHAQSGALRIVGGGLTSPDTLLPTGESLMRDWLLGIQWVRENLGVTPTSAWQPDSFGHSPTLPSILEQFGFRSIGFFRVDGGAYATVTAGKSLPITPGTTASTLSEQGTADYLWRAPDGAEVLARWLPFGYSQGDDLDFSFPWITISGFGIDWNQPPWIDTTITNDRFAAYIEGLEPLRRTPYTFLPVGTDFSWPKRQLLDYVKRWNDERYSTTGVWIVAATFEEYTTLQLAHRRELPELELDISPYFTGFYTTHAGLKSTLRQAHEALTAAEKVGSIAAEEIGAVYPFDDLDAGWDSSAFMNHHDAITGTATAEAQAVDLVPWSEHSLDEGIAARDRAMGWMGGSVDTSQVAGDAALVVFNPSSWERTDVVDAQVRVPAGSSARLAVVDGELGAVPTQVRSATPDADPAFEIARILFATPPVASVGHRTVGLRNDGPGEAAPAPIAPATLELRAHGKTTADLTAADEIVLSNGIVRAVMSRGAGFCLTSLRSGSGLELLNGPSNDLVIYRDLGGAYRIGSEMDRQFHQIDSSCKDDGRWTVEIAEHGPARVAVRLHSSNELGPIDRLIRLGAGLDRLDLRTNLATPDYTSAVARFRTAFTGDTLTTSVPFGEVARPRHKLFDPTFWPATEWFDLASPSGEGGLWSSSEGSRGVSASPEGVVEVMLTRNVFWDFLGPGGADQSSYAIRTSIGGRAGADWLSGGAHRMGVAAQSPLLVQVESRHGGGLPAAASWIELDRDDVEVSALKEAHDRSGDLVLRLIRHGTANGPVRVKTRLRSLGEVWAVDGLEGATDRVGVSGTAQDFTVDLERSIATVRLKRKTHH